MNYAAIKKTDIANGDGVRVSIWVSGCPIHCEGCFNKDLWNYNYGKPFTQDVIDKIIEALEPDYISGLTILGGEPLCEENYDEVTNLINQVRKKFGTRKTIWVYSGYTYSDLYSMKCGLDVDVLVDGSFILSEKDISLKFRGSRNQNIIRIT
jgi:anaerobic ribonucleoside-triphosphate reductase activating protein